MGVCTSAAESKHTEIRKFLSSSGNENAVGFSFNSVVLWSKSLDPLMPLLLNLKKKIYRENDTLADALKRKRLND